MTLTATIAIYDDTVPMTLTATIAIYEDTVPMTLTATIAIYEDTVPMTLSATIAIYEDTVPVTFNSNLQGDYCNRLNRHCQCWRTIDSSLTTCRMADFAISQIVPVLVLVIRTPLFFIRF